jgi:toxin YhaV
MTVEASGPVTIHGWTIYLHPLFHMQLVNLQKQVDALRIKDPTGYQRRNATKRLATIAKLAFDIIPQDPTRAEYRQGGTLGEQHKHWFRAKFFQQYRLFFRYHAASKIIVLAWVNDEDTKRAYESDDDAYRVFKKMPEKGDPRDDWDALVHAATRTK